MVLCIFGIVTSVPLIVLGDGFVVLKHRDIIELVVLLATLVFHLDALLKLSLKSLLSVQCKRRLLVPLLLLIGLLRTLICIVTLLLAVDTHNSHVLHLTREHVLPTHVCEMQGAVQDLRLPKNAVAA